MANNSKYKLMLEAMLDGSTLQRQIDDLQKKFKFNIEVNLNAQGSQQAQAAVDQVQKKVEQVKKDAGDVKIGVKLGNTNDVMALLQRKIEEIKKSVNTDVAKYTIQTSMADDGKEVTSATIQYRDALERAVTEQYKLVQLEGEAAEFKQTGFAYVDNEIAQEKKVTAELEKQRLELEKIALAKQKELANASLLEQKFSAKLTMYSGPEAVQGENLASQLKASIKAEDIAGVRRLTDEIGVLSVTLSKSSGEFERQQEILTKGTIVANEFLQKYKDINQYGVAKGQSLANSILTEKDATVVADYASDLKLLEKEIQSVAQEFEAAQLKSDKFLQGQAAGKYVGNEAGQATTIAKNLSDAVKSQDVDLVRDLSRQLDILSASLGTSSAAFKKESSEFEKYAKQAQDFITEKGVSTSPGVNEGLETATALSNAVATKDMNAARQYSDVLKEQNKVIIENQKLMTSAGLQADKFLEKSKTMGGKGVQDAIALAKQLKTAIAEGDVPAVAKLSRELDVATAAFKTSGFSIRNWISGLGDAMRITLEFAATSGLVNGAMQQLGNAVQYIKDLDKVMTDARVVTGMTADEADRLAVSYNNMARELGATTVEIGEGNLAWFLDKIM